MCSEDIIAHICSDAPCGSDLAQGKMVLSATEQMFTWSSQPQIKQIEEFP